MLLVQFSSSQINLFVAVLRIVVVLRFLIFFFIEFLVFFFLGGVIVSEERERWWIGGAILYMVSLLQECWNSNISL